MAHSKSILIIDDEPDIRETLKDALVLNGFDAVVASGAKQALKLLSENGKKPGVILLDLMMPERDGKDFIDDWKHSFDYERIPIVLISADGHVEAKSDSFKVDGFLKKPIDLNRLLQVVNHYCTPEDFGPQKVLTDGA